MSFVVNYSEKYEKIILIGENMRFICCVSTLQAREFPGRSVFFQSIRLLRRPHAALCLLEMHCNLTIIFYQHVILEGSCRFVK